MKGWCIVLAMMAVGCSREKGNSTTGGTGLASPPAMSPDSHRIGGESTAARGDTTMARDTATGGVWLEMPGPRVSGRANR